MPFINAPATTEAITVDGTASGYVTVTSNALYYPGATCWLRSGTKDPRHFRITDLSGTTKIGLQEIFDGTDFQHRGPNYTRSDVSDYKVGDTAQICQEASTVRVEFNNISKVPLI